MRYLVLSGLPLGILLGWSGAAWSEGIFKWVDQEGHAHFGDQPQKGAQKVEAMESLRYSPVPLPPKIDNANAQPPMQGGYPTFEILYPRPDETLQGDGDLTISLAVQPTLRPGHRLEVSLDGTPLQGNITSQFTLKGVVRGSHRLEGRILDEQGQEMARTGSVTFHFRQPIVKPEAEDRGKDKTSGNTHGGQTPGHGFRAAQPTSNDVFRASAKTYTQHTPPGEKVPPYDPRASELPKNREVKRLSADAGHPTVFEKLLNWLPSPRKNPFTASRSDYAPTDQNARLFESRQ